MVKKVIALVLVSILVLNVLLFAFRVVGSLVFWSVIGVVGLIAYLCFPKV